jgi:hypothetical protein
MAQSAAQFQKLSGQLQQVGREADATFATLTSLTVTADQRERFNDIQELSAKYIAALNDIGSKRAAILSFFAELDAAERKWARSVNIVINSEQFAFLSNMVATDALIKKAESAFQDARTAA